uniref:3-deoxy-manno-octulosonate cytidylyltransferase n=1 Tax=Wigglesworthia glossinidia brevipalpis TaxID=36870 RepID=KDSB_WIGBR|nr:RecName: Full=3-deoxy-manno-octulosonate cytidylyltransferase; AltName: Full=CMP-2-keto-3-deoxyoctulosonic acid synthase; Short=CKS; Short=CMP-KDO synthase [Wigglesworthia glossinidia endosymbiont of Glossina brevipalpis]
MEFIVIIPARFFSKRFPKKPLININGKPMIIHTIENAKKSGASRVIVVTDNNEIYSLVNKNGIEVLLTKKEYNSGTERLIEAIEKFKIKDNQIIVNLQVDEPFLNSDNIFNVAKKLKEKNLIVSTLAIPILNKKEIFDKNIVKVVIDINGYALYFSRSVIPWCENYNSYYIKNNFLKHVGIYAYYAKFVRLYSNYNSSKLEKMENLEQLRILWYGKRIYVSVENIKNCFSINTPSDMLNIKSF